MDLHNRSRLEAEVALAEQYSARWPALNPPSTHPPASVPLAGGGGRLPQHCAVPGSGLALPDPLCHRQPGRGARRRRGGLARCAGRPAGEQAAACRRRRLPCGHLHGRPAQAAVAGGAGACRFLVRALGRDILAPARAPSATLLCCCCCRLVGVAAFCARPRCFVLLFMQLRRGRWAFGPINIDKAIYFGNSELWHSAAGPLPLLPTSLICNRNWCSLKV